MNQFTQMIGLAVGWLLVGWVLLQGLGFVWRSLRWRARWRREYEKERAEFRQRVQATARAARASKAIPDWSGWRPFRVAAVVDEAHDVKSFYLAPVDGLPLTPFAPGQYLTFRLTLPGRDAALVRCYSLSDRPRQDYYRVTIKRLISPPGKPELPAGRGSGFFHERLHVGDELDVRAPAGTVFIDPQATEPIVLAGAGIGVTPLVSMIEAVLHTASRREVYALLGFRNGREHPFKARLKQLAASYPQFHLHVSYSSPRPEDVLHRDYDHPGRVTIERLRAVLPSNNFRFFVCGPAGLMESLVPALWEWGVPESHVSFEAFGPASVKRAPAAGDRSRLARPCDVRFERSNRTAVWDGSFATLLEFGEAAGIALPSGCRAGSCGECMTAVREGATVTLKRSGVAVPPGHCLTCISAPAGALVLDA